MIRTSVLALIVGVFATGCVVTTGGKPSRINHVQHHHHNNKSQRHTGNAAAPAPAPAPTTGGEAVAAPPIATPTPAPASGTTRAAIPNFAQKPGTPPAIAPASTEEEENGTPIPQRKPGLMPKR